VGISPFASSSEDERRVSVLLVDVAVGTFAVEERSSFRAYGEVGADGGESPDLPLSGASPMLL